MSQNYAHYWHCNCTFSQSGVVLQPPAAGLAAKKRPPPTRRFVCPSPNNANGLPRLLFVRSTHSGRHTIERTSCPALLQTIITSTHLKNTVTAAQGNMNVLIWFIVNAGIWCTQRCIEPSRKHHQTFDTVISYDKRGTDLNQSRISRSSLPTWCRALHQVQLHWSAGYQNWFETSSFLVKHDNANCKNALQLTLCTRLSIVHSNCPFSTAYHS